MAATACIRACIMHQMAACAMCPETRVEGQVGWTAIKVDTTPACGYASCKTNLELQCLEMAVETNLCGQMLESPQSAGLHVKLATSCQCCVFVSMSASLRHPFLRDIVSKFAALFVAFGQQVAHRRSALMRLSSQVAHEVVCINRIIMTLDADCFHYLFYCTIYFNCFLAIDNMLFIAQFILIY